MLWPAWLPTALKRLQEEVGVLLLSDHDSVLSDHRAGQYLDLC